MCAKKVTKVPGQVETTGHSWDGIEEFNNPMPRWWVWVFYATIVWGIGYTIAYPAWPLITGDPGLLGYRTRARTWRPRSSALTRPTPRSRPSWSRPT
jgi:cytochrome c oxidase cbb3-type subunit 3